MASARGPTTTGRTNVSIRPEFRFTRWEEVPRDDSDHALRLALFPQRVAQLGGDGEVLLGLAVRGAVGPRPRAGGPLHGRDVQGRPRPPWIRVQR